MWLMSPAVAQLAASQLNLDQFILQTRADAQSHLQTAQGLSLLRHSLSDETFYLSQELLSSMGEPEQPSTLLEDLETLHRNLKEQESVKSYVQVIHHALTLRHVLVYISTNFHNVYLHY
jgi:hypothetical protein